MLAVCDFKGVCGCVLVCLCVGMFSICWSVLCRCVSVLCVVCVCVGV